MAKEYPLALPPGSVLAGKYIVDRVLGQGGFGITYKATNYDTGSSVAIKEYFPDCLATRVGTTVTHHGGEYAVNYTYGMDCFLEEAKTLASFSGVQGIVSIYCYFEENSTAYYVMDYLEGQSFSEYISQKGGKLSYEETERIMLPVMEALSKVHEKGVVHRDVAPDNIYILKDGTIKLLDFGAARQSLGDKSKSLDVVLKHGFAPKEQYSRRGRQGPFTDVYSTAACFYTALTGHRPMDSIDRLENDELLPPSREGVAIPPEKENALMMALAVQAANRFQKMSAFISALRGMIRAQQHPMQQFLQSFGQSPSATVAVFGNGQAPAMQSAQASPKESGNAVAPSYGQNVMQPQAPRTYDPKYKVKMAMEGKTPPRQPSMNPQVLRPYDPNYQKASSVRSPQTSGNTAVSYAEQLQEKCNHLRFEMLQLNEEKRNLDDFLRGCEDGLAECSAREFSRKNKLSAKIKQTKEQILSVQEQIDGKMSMIQQMQSTISRLPASQTGNAESASAVAARKQVLSQKEEMQESLNRWKLELLQMNEEKQDMEDILHSYEEGLAECSASEFSRKHKLTVKVKKIKEQIQSKQQQIERKAGMIQQIQNSIKQLNV